MENELCANLVANFVGGLPKQIGKQLEDVELYVFANPKMATDELREMMEAPEGGELEAIPDDCKGVFLGEPLEREEDDETEGMETVSYPTGVIAIVSSNVKDPDEAVLVVLHEIGHALGMDEDEVKALGLGVSPSTTGAPNDGPTTPANE